MSVEEPSTARSSARHSLAAMLIGDLCRTEFRQAISGAESLGALPTEFLAVDSLAAAEAALADGPVMPELIVLAQSYPGQISQSGVDRLRRLAPLARFVGLMGSWCEGEMRSGAPWAGVVRTYWHQWPPRWERQIYNLAQGRRCAWALPPTAAEEERLLADAGLNPHERLPSSTPHGVVVIHSLSRDMAQLLSDACRGLGWATVWHRPPSASPVAGATAAIFESDNLSDEQFDTLCRLSDQMRPAPVIAVLSFPRIDDFWRATSAGAASVLSKPLSLDDLAWELQRIGTSPCDN